MRIALLVLLNAGCPAAPATKPQPVQRTTSDNTCENVAWSCVGMKPGTQDAWGCVEGNASQTSQYQASCTVEKDGRFALNACLRDNLVGGCTLARGNQCTTTWYYAPASRESVEADCEKQDALYVAP
jgi:hypothetical protein